MLHIEYTMPKQTRSHRSESLGPNLQSRLEALEAAMGVRLNVAKRQGRQSLSTTSSSSPMQISPTSTSSTVPLTSLSACSSRHNIPSRSGQGVQRSASSCDTENRPGPIKRLKPTVSIEHSSPSTASAIATVKKYPPPVRRALATTTTTTASSTSPTPTSNSSVRLIQSKTSPIMKCRTSPMDTSSMRSSRSSVTSTNSSNSSHYRTPMGGSPKISTRSSAKQRAVQISPPPPPLPARAATYPRKQRLSIFGEQFSDDILKTNLLWIKLNELDDDARTEVLIQFGSIENFLREQRLFAAKQEEHVKLAADKKFFANRSRFQMSIPKKDRLELL